MKIYLDNILVQYPQDNLQYPTFTITKTDDNGNQGITFTGELTFVGPEYDYIKSKLIDDTNALLNKIIIEFKYDCCPDLPRYQFAIIADSLKWCENVCSVDANAIAQGVEVTQLNCLQNTLIWDNWNGFTSTKKHPRFTYCNELRPSWMHDTLLILVILLTLVIAVFLPMLLLLATIVTIINFIINAVNNIPGVNLNTIQFDNDPTTNTYQELLNWIDTLLKTCIGCGRKHPSPLVRDYADNVCGKCGTTFNSTIFKDGNSPYYNLAWHNAPIDKGLASNNNTDYWIDRNKPLLNGTEFFDQLKGAFNAYWVVKQNILYFERRDFFSNQVPWIDLTIMNKDDYTLCWSWSQKTRYSYGSFQYQKDAVNWVGSEACERWSDIVEWNNPYTDLQSGSLEPLIQFAACRFRDDGIDRDVLSTYKHVPGIGPIIQQYDDVILLNSHTCYTPMLLVWDPTSGYENSKVSGGATFFNNVSNNDIPQTFVALNQFYNYQMWFNGNFPGNLYSNFWFIENPHQSQYQGFGYTAEIPLTCENLQNLDIYGMIKTSKGNAQIDEININFASNVISLTGTI